MMDDDEYDDELPSISVNSKTQEPASFCMPSAEELASERAREEQCERELRALREAADEELAAGLARCDSSGSEGEAALAAAVSALAVRPAGAAAAGSGSRAPRPAAALRALGAALAGGAAAGAAPEDVAAAGGWLCGQVAGGAGGEARRALHRLLVDVGIAHVPAIARAALESVRSPRARLDLVDAALAAGPEPGARLLAGLACRAALADLAADQADTTPSAPSAPSAPLTALEAAHLAAGWRRAPPADGYLMLQLAARALLAATDRGHLRPALAALAALPQPAAAITADRHRPDYLKVVVAASKLQLLFRDND